MGDFDGDGLEDAAATAYSDDDGGSGAGAAYVIPSATVTSGNVASIAYKLVGENSSDMFGGSIAEGDIDGDGRDDLLVGATGSDRGGTSSGSVYLFYGALSAGMDGSRADASGGDLTGDGLDDIVVGAGGDDSGGSSAGALYVVSDPAGIVDLSLADAKLTGTSSSDGLGLTLPLLLDLDGDGFDDLLAGAVGADGDAGQAGAAYGWFGPSLPTPPPPLPTWSSARPPRQRLRRCLPGLRRGHRWRWIPRFGNHVRLRLPALRALCRLHLPQRRRRDLPRPIHRRQVQRRPGRERRPRWRRASGFPARRQLERPRRKQREGRVCAQRGGVTGAQMLPKVPPVRALAMPRLRRYAERGSPCDIPHDSAPCSFPLPARRTSSWRTKGNG